jgi:hypothetical protein
MMMLLILFLMVTCFPKALKKNTLREIFVMGNRNPYRISVDQKNSYLYWGEVGPDAYNDSLETRGPRGYV